MSTLGELLREPMRMPAENSAERHAPIPRNFWHRNAADATHEHSEWRSDPEIDSSASQSDHSSVPSRRVPASVRDEQIHALVQQLFFREDSNGARNVGFAALESSSQNALICLDVAKVLAVSGKYDVGLIDVAGDTDPLHRQLSLHFAEGPSIHSAARAPAKSRDRAELIWPILSRLWLVPWQSWSTGSGIHTVTDQDLDRLREFTTQFDFSILYCSPVSWLSLRIAQACDGLVLILTANRTRRLVAAQIKEQLLKARVPILGTVLAERRLPVPAALYRNL